MNLRFITCSDPRENLNVTSVIDLLKTSSLAELGVQAHPSAMMRGKKRYVWFRQVLDAARSLKTPVNIALHVNFIWCNDICSGKVPDEIGRFLAQEHTLTHQPLITRVQLNVDDTTRDFDAEKLAQIISDWDKFEVILPFNKITQPKIEKLRATGAQFSLLFDGSYGAGVAPKNWLAPAYDDIAFGYAGGLSPFNVRENLDKIAALVPADYDTWIDAEGRLRDITTGAMDIGLAREYLNNALAWYKQHSK